MTYKFLLFDLDHTLLDFATGEEIALTQFLEFMEVEDIQAFKDVYRPLNQGMWKDLEKGLITKKELVNTRFSRAFAHFGRQEDGAELALRYQEFIGRQGQIFEGAADLLETLTERGYQIYGATNGITYIQENRFKHSPIGSYFKQVFISEQMGTQKPELDFYDKIAEQITGFDLFRALMIGDSLTADIQGGINAGMDTVWYNPAGLENTSHLKPTYTISNYQQLIDIL